MLSPPSLRTGTCRSYSLIIFRSSLITNYRNKFPHFMRPKNIFNEVALVLQRKKVHKILQMRAHDEFTLNIHPLYSQQCILMHISTSFKLISFAGTHQHYEVKKAAINKLTTYLLEKNTAGVKLPATCHK